MRRRRALAVLAAFALSCKTKGEGAPQKSGPPRVVSISPSTTEALFAIDAGALVVGRSKYCDYPKDVEKLPAVGGFADPNVEAILALAPTLVVGAHGPAGPALEEKLKAHGVATFFPETESFAQIESMLKELGDRLDRAAAARASIDRIESARARVKGVVASRPRVKVALLFDVNPIVAAGPGGFPDELLREAGGDNVVTSGGAYPTVSLEHLLKHQPDVLLDGASDGEAGGASRVLALKDAQGYRDLEALKHGRVKLVSTGSVLRPGPRIGEGLVAIARALHGDLPELAP